MPYVVGVSTPIPSERKPYVPYVVGVGSPIHFQGAGSFSYMLYVRKVAAISKLLCKKYECRYTHSVRRGVLTKKKKKEREKKSWVYGHPHLCEFQGNVGRYYWGYMAPSALWIIISAVSLRRSKSNPSSRYIRCTHWSIFRRPL